MPNITDPSFDPNKLAGNPISNTDQNTQNAAERRIHLNMQELINGIGAPSNTFTDDINSIEGRVQVLESYTVLTAKGQWTKDHGNKWYDIVYKDADEIVIKCKPVNGLGSWIGVILNDGTYLELTSDYTIKYDTPANSGHIIDGITAKLNNEWFWVCPYEDSGGALAFGILWMPHTTFTNANPTNTLTLAQVNGQDIGFLYPADSHLVCWQDADEWETPLAWQNAGAVTYDATKDKPKVSSRTATVLTLGANLENNNFTAGSAVYQVDNFEPRQVSDGAIASVIGARGWMDSGFRFRTDGGGNITRFNVNNKIVTYEVDHSSVGVLTGTSTATNNLATYTPPDVKIAVIRILQDLGGAGVAYASVFRYWDLTANYWNMSFATSIYASGTMYVEILHRIIGIQGSGVIANQFTQMGYEMS
jgi:hypothetical protein